MLFNSFQFLCFFIVVWPIFLLLRGTARKVFLLVASYYFYMCWSPKYILVIWAITAIDFVAGLRIERASSETHRKVYLGLSLACNLGLLFVFKYLNFAARSTSTLLHAFGFAHDLPLLNVLLPVGLSFHTFQAMSYTIDVFKGKAPASSNLIDYALYVAFFPQMVAGPIERPNQLLPQFMNDPSLRIEALKSGVTLAVWGLFKKMVIADSVASFVTMVYASPKTYTGSALLLATILFSIQIYCDFSGYSDIAIGIARMMGYELNINFRQPYFSRSIGEFWRHWHISLSSWFKDYVYIPLGGNRGGRQSHYVNLLITFLISGLWHGAAWTFVIWGALHGTYLVVSQSTATFRQRLRAASGIARFPTLEAAWQVACTGVLVVIGWAVFRANSLQDAWYIVTHMLTFGGFDPALFKQGLIPRANVPFLVAFICAMFMVEWWLANPSRVPKLWESGPFRKLCYYACAYSIVFFGVFGHVDFIYFQF